MIVGKAYRLPSLTTVYAPEGIQEAAVRKQLLSQYQLEIGGGLGDFKGRAWRIGLMGYASTQANVVFCLTALGNVLTQMGHHVPLSEALDAALKVYGQA